MRRPTDHEVALAVEQVATARSLVCEPACSSSTLTGWPSSAGTKTRGSGDLSRVPVTVPAPEPGEDLALVACEAIEAALGARQDEIARIGFACADQDIDAGWVLAYMYDG